MHYGCVSVSTNILWDILSLSLSLKVSLSTGSWFINRKKRTHYQNIVSILDFAFSQNINCLNVFCFCFRYFIKKIFHGKKHQWGTFHCAHRVNQKSHRRVSYGKVQVICRNSVWLPTAHDLVLKTQNVLYHQNPSVIGSFSTEQRVCCVLSSESTVQLLSGLYLKCVIKQILWQCFLLNTLAIPVYHLPLVWSRVVSECWLLLWLHKAAHSLVWYTLPFWHLDWIG